ncbi:bark agglutinin I polypeptide B-like [Salvia divinorum]|uniref:Bark agglutinin I polypeptide B-like n=1 Tax=Salvia divinorum TaxID=28513 RepID=A0ABD1FLW6_SALDI
MASFQYNFYDKKVKDLIYQFDTHYPKQDPVLRLTKTDENSKALPWSTGRILYSKNVPFGPAVDFKTTVKFTVKPNDNAFPIADGLAFFIVPEDHPFPEGKNPPPGGNLGLFEQAGKSSNVFAVAFDTYLGIPYYVNLGIDIEHRKPEANVNVPYSFVGKELTLVVSYNGATRAISASVTYGSETFPVSLSYNLATILPSGVRVGLASTTAQNVAVHDVHYWDFTSTAP